MQPQDIIVITGAAGFIGSYLAGYLNRKGYHNLVLVDDFSVTAKRPNWEHKIYSALVHRDTFAAWLDENEASYIFHLGARTDTTEMDYAVHKKWNVDYSKEVWNLCTARQIPLLYASSAATYGGGEFGYSDAHETVALLKPLNPYGQSKQDFDLWALSQEKQPPFWAGVKFFNVYGPNEYHKGRMASVMLHAWPQIAGAGRVKLFRSHNPACKDGGQMRDFVYVRDVAEMITYLMNTQPENGLYNIGSGIARPFIDLVNAMFMTAGTAPAIDFIDTPADIRDKYQYFTEADMSKLRTAGFTGEATSLEAGIADYATNFLKNNAYF